MGDVSALSAADIESASIAGGVARLQRCEDGAWDPRENRNNDFYFVTTASGNNNCRLWRLRFDDIRDPEQGERSRSCCAATKATRCWTT